MFWCFCSCLVWCQGNSGERECALPPWQDRTSVERCRQKDQEGHYQLESDKGQPGLHETSSEKKTNSTTTKPGQINFHKQHDITDPYFIPHTEIHSNAWRDH